MREPAPADGSGRSCHPLRTSPAIGIDAGVEPGTFAGSRQGRAVPPSLLYFLAQLKWHLGAYGPTLSSCPTRAFSFRYAAAGLLVGAGVAGLPPPPPPPPPPPTRRVTPTRRRSCLKRGPTALSHPPATFHQPPPTPAAAAAANSL
jgi:hypothetical protein